MAGEMRSYLGWLLLGAPRPARRVDDQLDRPAPAVEERRPVAHKVDSRLEDPLALDEIELYGELVIAASASDGPLSQDQIDRVLGVGAARGTAGR
jgi:hypothetical protein